MNRSRMDHGKATGDPVSLAVVLSSRALSRQTITLQNTTGEGLSGWAGIEDHLMTHDGGEMQDYSDDIDTMLVFVRSFIVSKQVC